MSESRLHLHFLSLLLLCCVSPSYLSTTNPDDNSYVACGPHQTQALTEFMNEFDSSHCNLSDPFNGVWCDNSTGAVTMIRLQDCLSGILKPNSSLFKLHHLRYLDLNHNNFTSSSLPSEFGSQVPSSFNSLSRLSLSDLSLAGNQFSGTLNPNSTSLFELHHLRFLGLGYNKFSSSLPSEFGNLNKLEYLSLKSNDFSGQVPPTISNLTSLKELYLQDNQLTGSFPLVQNLTMLSAIDVSDNHFSGTIPSSLTTIPFFSNKFYGSISPPDQDRDLYMVHRTTASRRLYFASVETIDLRYKGLSMEQEMVLTSYAAIDFSGNRIEGQIPESIGLLKALIALNLSNNAFTGHIPLGLGTLSFLAYINVSHNHLKGEIPQGTQITGQAKSSFEGNAGLCGLPLQETCFGTIAPPTQQPPKEEDEQVLNWKGVAIGYGLGVLLGLAIAQLIASYKPEWLVKIIGPNKLRTLRIVSV
ncbi:BnaC04g43230D [Brassica napus]|uniref:(rape) hypothetical protein n=1 Tax=Brassica napus TaxID=3708 RepID=A0A078IEX0_BRANA|nr:unnamed protein product [Brassica napus]CDY48526.1 BnaC04g43230D [Brassica napus]